MAAGTSGFQDDDVVGKIYDARLARRLLVSVRPYGGLVAAALTLLLIDGALQLVGPLLTRHVIDVAIPARDTAAITRDAIWYAAALALAFIAQYGETMIT